MNPETTNTAMVVSTESLLDFQQQLVQQVTTLSSCVQQLTEAVARERVVSPWIGADEAALLLGIKITEQGYHTRILKKYIDKGLITRFKEGKPRVYWKAHIQALAIKISNGEVQYL